MNHQRLIRLPVMALFYFLSVHSLSWADEKRLYDPTKPFIIEKQISSASSQEPEEQYILKSIIYSSNRQLILINDTYLSLGDKIGLDTIESINRNSIVLSRPGQKKMLYLFDEMNPVEKRQ